jgi:histidinol phosphatase-like enzyme
MLLDAAKKFNIALNVSWIVGDDEKDVLAGKAAGCKTALINARGVAGCPRRWGCGRNEASRSAPQGAGSPPPDADVVCKSLADFVTENL